MEADQSHSSRLKKLLHGRIEVAFIGNGDLGLAMPLESDEDLQREKDQFVLIEPPLNHDLLYLGFAKSMHMQPFLQAFNKPLAQAHTSQAVPGRWTVQCWSSRPDSHN